MDLLRNYRDFTKDIFDGFQSLRNEFDMRLITPSEGLYVLHNDKCGIKFTYDRGDVSCAFLRRSDSLYDYGYLVGSVFRYLHPDKIHDNDSVREYDRRKQIFDYAKVINDHLKNVLEGDFTWLDGFLKNQDEWNKPLDFVLRNLPYEHPISKKLWSGDQSWRNDLQQYLNQNNIKI